MRVVVFDTETTGLIDNHIVRLSVQPEIIEFASVALDWDGLAVDAEYDQLIKPRLVSTLPKETVESTHILDEDLVGKPHFGELAPLIKEQLEAAEVVVGHNLAFDMEMVDLEFERLGERIAWPDFKICTIEQSSFYVGHRLNLTDLLKALVNEDHSKAHRALEDARATAKCFVAMRSKGWL